MTSVVGHGIGTDSEQQFLPFYSAYSSDQEHQQLGLLHDARASRGWSRRRRSGAARDRATSGPKCFSSLVDAGAGAVQRRSAAAVDPGAVHQSRPRAADADGHRHDRPGAGRRRAGVEHPRGQRPEPSVRAAGRRRGVVARHQPPVAQLPVARADRRRRKGPRRCAICSSCTRRAPTSAPGGRSRASASVRVGRVVRRLQRAGPAGVRPRPRDHPCRSTSSRSRAAAPSCSDRCSIAISRVTCRSTRSRKRCCDPRSAGRSIDGACNGARDRRSERSSTSWRRRRYRYDFYQTLRRLECLHDAKPRWGQALRPVDEPVRLGQDPDLSFAPAPLAVVRAPRRPAAAAAGAAVRPVRPQRAAADSPHRIRARAAAACRRSDAQPLSRRLSPPLPRAVLPRLGPGPAARQPRSPEGGSLHGLRRTRSWAWRRRRFASATRCRTWRSSFTSARSIRQVRNAEGLAHILQHFFRVPVKIEEFVGHWMSLSRRRADVAVGRRRARSASGAVLGGRVWDRQHKFRIHLGPLTHRPVRELSAGRHAAAQSWSTGSGCISASSSTGMSGCC